MAEGAAHLLAKLTQAYPDESSSLQAATRLALALSALPGSRERLINCSCVRCAQGSARPLLVVLQAWHATHMQWRSLAAIGCLTRLLGTGFWQSSRADWQRCRQQAGSCLVI